MRATRVLPNQIVSEPQTERRDRQRLVVNDLDRDRTVPQTRSWVQGRIVRYARDELARLEPPNHPLEIERHDADAPGGKLGLHHKET
jgi:hypothetical protein